MCMNTAHQLKGEHIQQSIEQQQLTKVELEQHIYIYVNYLRVNVNILEALAAGDPRSSYVCA